jgi:hypothetical protein
LRYLYAQNALRKAQIFRQKAAVAWHKGIGMSKKQIALSDLGRNDKQCMQSQSDQATANVIKCFVHGNGSPELG